MNEANVIPMQQRNYKNYIDAYVELNADQFVPKKFVKWAAISTVAGALERKVWLPWSQNFSYYPNMYILLVSHPGIGKSTAINPAISMLRELMNLGGALNFIPNQVTEAKLIELMAIPSAFDYKNKIIQHCSGYYSASEASASLKDIYGSFINTITSFYDCDQIWEKAIVGKEHTMTLVNVCFNLIAGCTFDYLGKLITEDNIMGGFASRCIYVMQKEAMARVSPFQNRGIQKSSPVDRDKLLGDLSQIHHMTGPFRADEQFAAAWESWFPHFDTSRQNLQSEKYQALLVRKPTNLIKLCMILSAAESNDRVLKLHHWEDAMEMINEVELDLPDMLREGTSKNTESQEGLNNAVFKHLIKAKRNTMKLAELEQKLVLAGFDRSLILKTFDTFRVENEALKVVRTTNGDTIELLGNPNDYL